MILLNGHLLLPFLEFNQPKIGVRLFFASVVRFLKKKVFFSFSLFQSFLFFPIFRDFMINEWTPFICSVKSVYIGFTDPGEGCVCAHQRGRERESEREKRRLRYL